MSTTFRGVFSEIFGGILTVRGFAYFSDLAKNSQPNDAYQRKPYEKHLEEIEQFYRNKHELFFPELVFALPLDKINISAGKYIFSSNESGVKVKLTGTRTSTTLERINLTLPDLPEGDRLLHRIDGNHRLRAYENLDDAEFDRYLVPFCIVLLRKEQAPTIEKSLFYNINSKVKPLTSEESYRSIIEDEVGFPDDVLERDFGTEFLICRETLKELNFTYLSNLRGIFGQNVGQADNRCTALITSLKDLQKEKLRIGSTSPLPNKDKFLQSIKKLNEIYADERMLRSNSIGLFSAFMFFDIQNKIRCQQFENWVLRNHQYELKEINAADLIRIFEKIAESRKRQVFVSMQFSDNTMQNYQAIKHAVNDLNVQFKLNIKINPIRIDQFETGYSYQINDEILKMIEDSGLLIADLTAGNKNVYHEIGYLMGLNEGRGLKNENFILIHNDGAGDSKKDIGFNLSGIKQIRVSDSNKLREDLKKQVAIYYGLIST